MSYPPSPALPSTARLVLATLLAIVVAAVILVTAVLPAEYGIDPTGIGARLGLDALQPAVSEPVTAEPATAEAAAPSLAAPAVVPTEANAALAASAAAAFRANAGQSFDAAALSSAAGALRTDTLLVTLEPGKGAEVKSALKAGEGLVFRWTASADVAVDMHGEAAGAKGTWTSYAVETAQREAAGTFVARFDGTHGWYWQNRGTEPVTVEIVVTGFQPSLYRP